MRTHGQCEICGHYGTDCKCPSHPARIKPKTITIERAEGMAEECIKRSVTSWNEANAMLRLWSATAPKTGGYDKCDFWIAFDDGQEYSGRYDLKHWQIERPSLNIHVKSFVSFLAGNPPAWMQCDPRALTRYEADRAAHPDEVQEAKTFLATYDLGD